MPEPTDTLAHPVIRERNAMLACMDLYRACKSIWPFLEMDLDEGSGFTIDSGYRLAIEKVRDALAKVEGSHKRIRSIGDSGVGVLIEDGSVKEEVNP